LSQEQQQQQQQQPSTVQPDNSNQNVNNRSQGRVSSQFQNQSQPSTQPSQPQPQQQQQQQQPKRYSTKRDQIVNAVAAPSTLSIDTSNVLPAQTSPLHSPVQVVPVPAPTTIYRLNNPLTATNPPLYGTSFRFFFTTHFVDFSFNIDLCTAGFNYHPYAPSEVNNPYLVTPATPLYSSLPLTVVPQVSIVFLYKICSVFGEKYLIIYFFFLSFFRVISTVMALIHIFRLPFMIMARTMVIVCFKINAIVRS
jgi:hypothetical protein